VHKPLVIKKYLYLPFLVILSALSIGYLIFDGYSTLVHTFEQSRQIIERQNTTQSAISRMYKASQERAITLLEMNRTTDDFELDYLRQRMREQADMFLSAREEITALASSSTELERYFPQSLREQLTENAAFQNKAANLFVEQKHEEALKVMREYSLPEQMEILSGLALMNTRLDNDIGAILSGLNEKVADAKLDFKLLGVFTFLVFTTFVVVIIMRLLHGKNALSGRLKYQGIQYKRIVDTVQDGVITMSREGVISSFNPGAEKVFGYRANDMVGDNLKQLIDSSGYRSLDRYIATVIEGTESLALGLIGKRIDDESVTLLITFSTTGLSGEQELCGILKDITVQKKNEEEQVRKSKLESIGVLAGGIAHDFNNILSGINGYTELALHSLADDKEKTIHYLESSKKATRRATDLAQQLLTFAKGGEPIKQDAQVADVIYESADFNLHGSKVRCQYNISDDLWMVNIDNNQISQVIQNIILNAKLAMPQGGEINIGCQNTVNVLAEGVIKASGRFVKITIEDTGTGMSKEVLASIFDPYFTTRETGSGLGLALSYSIISKHDGYIYADSEPGAGACFTIYLPASAEQV